MLALSTTARAGYHRMHCGTWSKVNVHVFVSDRQEHDIWLARSVKFRGGLRLRGRAERSINCDASLYRDDDMYTLPHPPNVVPLVDFITVNGDHQLDWSCQELLDSSGAIAQESSKYIAIDYRQTSDRVKSMCTPTV
jgi:hypothetical protein